MPRNRSEKQPHDCTNRRGPDDICGGCVQLDAGVGRSVSSADLFAARDRAAHRRAKSREVSERSVSNDELFAAYERLKAKAQKARKQADVIGNKLMRDCQIEMLQKANDWARERDAKK